MEIERSSNDKIRIVIFCSKPGLLIGRKGADIDLLRKNLSKMVNKEILIEISKKGKIIALRIKIDKI